MTDITLDLDGVEIYVEPRPVSPEGSFFTADWEDIARELRHSAPSVRQHVKQVFEREEALE